MDNFNNKWFDRLLLDNQDFSLLRQNPVAYFCAEFALSDIMPIYSGGLGVLAGDLIKEADELGIPFVGVGLLYKKGFFKQTIDGNSEQVEQEQQINPRTAGMSLVLNSEGNVFIQSIPVDGRIIHFQTWQLKIGSVDMYFLDTHVEGNSEEDKAITDTLYGGDNHTRILQEILLGIGGEKMLFAQGIYPAIYHMNEGHSAFAALGIIHHHMKLTKADFATAYAYVQKKLIFTNHTLVPAGNDVFPKDLVETNLKEYAMEVGVPLDEFIQKGLTPDGTLFSMTIFALNLSFKVNAVSILHSQKAKALWPNYEMIPVTNGVNLSTWINPVLYHKLLDSSLENNIPFEEAVNFISRGDLWKIHQEMKENLLKEVFNISGNILDKDIITMTWARRIAGYKRPDLMFLDIEKLKYIMNNIQKPVQIIIAGKPHPHDEEGKRILHNILENIKKINETNRIVFLPNYSMTLAKSLVSGSDLWLNNPMRGYEASGTSGMKAGANGVLQFTVKDGWTDEVDWNGKGWVIDDNDASQSLYWQLESDITSTYYNRQNGLPDTWIEMMINTMNTVLKQYSAKRMLIDYFNKMYVPSMNAQAGK